MKPLLDAAPLEAQKTSIWRKLFLILAILCITGFGFMHFVYPGPNLNPDGTSQWTSLGLTSQSIPTSIPTPLKVNVPVLMYHYIRVVENPQQDKLGVSLSVTPDDFDKQMAYITAHGFTPITPDDLWQALNKQAKLPAKPILLTFDDGYADFYTAAWPILKKYNVKATVYVVTGFLGDDQKRYMSWDEVKELDTSGLITIGDHTIHHANVAVSANAAQEISLSKKQLETYLDHPITSFVYPGGTFNDKAVGLVNTAGFNLAFTTVEGRVHTLDQRLVLPRVRISGTMNYAKFVERVNGIY